MVNFKNKSLIFYLISLSVFLFVFVIFSLNLGGVGISVKEIVEVLLGKLTGRSFDIRPSSVFIIWNLRLPRILLATLVGASLSISGVALQGIFKNPMAEPFVTGTSAGASFGATLAIIFFNGSNISISLSAFIFSIFSSFLVYYLAQNKGKIDLVNLLLAGIVLSSLLSAFVSFLMIFNEKELISIFTYTMGSFNASNWMQVNLLFITTFLGFFILYSLHKELNILSLGDESAKSMGVEVERTKKLILVSTSFITAIAVSYVGIIAFVGLIVPHFFRLLIGSNHKKLLPMCFLGGAIFMLFCDNLSRTLIDNSEIPVGIITSIIGAPLFLYLLNKRKR